MLPIHTLLKRKTPKMYDGQCPRLFLSDISDLACEKGVYLSIGRERIYLPLGTAEYQYLAITNLAFLSLH